MTRRMSIGVEREITDAIEVRVNVFDEVTSDRFRSSDVNAPIDGIRPNHPVRVESPLSAVRLASISSKLRFLVSGTALTT